MGGVVADQLQRPGVVAIDELDPGVAIDGLGEVDDRAVERHGDGALGERRRNRLGHFEAGGAIGIIPTGAVGEGQRDHVKLRVAHSLPTDAGKRAHDIYQPSLSGNACGGVSSECGGSGQTNPTNDHIPVKRSHDPLRND